MVAGPAISIGRSSGILMNRTVILVSGVVCWTIAAVDAGVHLLAGDLVVPLGMAAIFAVWVGLRLTLRRPQPVPAA
jgi:hypothetical protein